MITTNARERYDFVASIMAIICFAMIAAIFVIIIIVFAIQRTKRRILATSPPAPLAGITPAATTIQQQSRNVIVADIRSHPETADDPYIVIPAALNGIATPFIFSTALSGIFLHPKHSYWQSSSYVTPPTSMQAAVCELQLPTAAGAPHAITVSYPLPVQMLSPLNMGLSQHTVLTDEVMYGTAGIPVPADGGIIGCGPAKQALPDGQEAWLNPLFYIPSPADSTAPPSYAMTVWKEGARVHIAPFVDDATLDWCWSSLLHRNRSVYAITSVAVMPGGNEPCLAVWDLGMWRSVIHDVATTSLASLSAEEEPLTLSFTKCQLILPAGSYYTASTTTNTYNGADDGGGLPHVHQNLVFLGLSAGSRDSAFCIDAGRWRVGVGVKY
jgi:hypothetical protein